MKRYFKKPFFIISAIIITMISLPAIYLLLTRPELIDNGIVKLSATFHDHKATVWSAKFSPDGSLLASGSVDSTVIIRKTGSGEILKVLRQPEGVTGIDFTRSGDLLATSSYDGLVRLWNIKDGSLKKVFHGHNGTVWTVACSPDGRRIAAAGEDKLIMVWDINSGNIVHTLKGHSLNVWTIKFDPAGKTLASGSFDNDIRTWDMETGNLIKVIAGHTQAVVDIAFSHNGRLLASASDDKTLKIWNIGEGSLLKEFEVPEHVQAVAFSPDDKRLMTGGKDKAMFGELIQNFAGESEQFKGVSGRLWDIEAGKIIQTFNTHKNDVNDISYSNDGLWIVTASEDKTIDLWRVIK